MTVIRLPDGSKRKYEHPVTVGEVAASIGAGLARAALAGKVNGKLVDISAPIETGGQPEALTPPPTLNQTITANQVIHQKASRRFFGSLSYSSVMD